MGQEAKRMLMDRLDENLRYHAETVDHLDIGSIYYLQALAELHYYLKTEHGFSPAEVKALLYFEDPLEAVFHCKEENTHAGRFPVCEILEEINAYGRFKKMPEFPQLYQKHRELKRRLTQDLEEYKEQILTGDRDMLLKDIRLMGAAFEAYDFMMDSYEPRMGEVDFLLQFEKPLRVIRDYWGYDSVLVGEDAIKVLIGEQCAMQKQEPRPESLKERLLKAGQEVKAQPGTDKGVRGPRHAEKSF